MRRWILSIPAACLGLVTAACATTAGGPGQPSQPGVSTIREVSAGCAGQNSEIEQAVGSGYVYEEWMGCKNSIGFAASADGGLHFGKPVVLPDSAGAWDPSVAVAPDGTVYAAFMLSAGQQNFPVVAASTDHGQTFPRETRLVPAQSGNWGDRDFIAVGPTGIVYLTWDYGPSAKDLRVVCTKGGSCSFAAGDVNIVLQTSTDGARTFGAITHVSPGFPASGGDSAPLLVRPDGRIYVEYQGFHVASPTKFTLTTGHSFATSSADGGMTWSAPVRIGPASLTMGDAEWWIDGDISADSGGTLYVTWDTQSGGHDIGWLAYSTDGGRTWSRLVRVTPDSDSATHIVEVAGGKPGVAYVGWLADNVAGGYELWVRPFSITKGWLSAAVQVSTGYATSAIWPGDTFGISAEAPLHSGPRAGWPRIVVSWGGAVGAYSQDRAAVIAFPPR